MQLTHINMNTELSVIWIKSIKHNEIISICTIIDNLIV